MALYLISYDITEEDATEYEPLYEKLESLAAKKSCFQCGLSRIKLDVRLPFTTR